MLSIDKLEKYDSQGMYKVYDRWPEIAQECYNLEHKPIKLLGLNHIVFCGMGGSGAIGDMFSSILSKTNIHVSIVKGYLIPNTINKNSLVVVTSISGNTIETLTILESAQNLNCKVIVFSAGGKMKSLCKKNTEFKKSEECCKIIDH